MQNQTEEWRVALGFPEYDVSNLGNVRSKRSGKILKKTFSPNGCAEILLFTGEGQRRQRITRLVWTTFKGDVPKRTRFAHINGDLADDRLENLTIKPFEKDLKLKKEKPMKLTREEFAARLEAARNTETPEQPGSVAAEIAADLKREKAISKRIETPEITSKAPDTPTITAKVETPEKPDRSVSYLVNYDPKTTHTSGTIHGPLDQVVKMLGSVGLEKAIVTVTFGE